MNTLDFFQLVSDYNNIANAVAKTHKFLTLSHSPACSISGGADSDILLDIVHKLDNDNKVRYIWFNTGLEYQATKKHIQELEEKYSIRIERINAVKSIPQCCKEFGQPFLSKFVSENISRLQLHGFDFSDMSFEDMSANFPNAKSAVAWWHNKRQSDMFNINQHKFLKQFLIAHPPSFKISQKCCYFVKKKPAELFMRENDIDLNIIGVRKAEGGIRSFGNSCVTVHENVTTFRPLFWFSQLDKDTYCNLFDIQYSECYSLYGLKRTGCAGCPFNRKLFEEIQQVKDFEHGLVTAASNVFKESYEYTRLYREFCSNMKNLQEVIS